MRVKVSELVSAVGGELISGNLEDSFEFVSTDTREAMTGKLFIPLKGESFDGHNYIESAVTGGAIGYITQNNEKYPDTFAVKVADTKKSLGSLAKYVLSKSKAKVIAVTGSVGKTTTRQFVASVLSQLGKTLATSGNFNNDIGLPLTVLKMEGDEEYIVLEMGMNSFGEISYLSKVAQPDIAVITLAGTSHIERLGSRENILKAKLEIIDGLKESGILIFNGDDPVLYSLRDKYNPEYYGISNGKYKVQIISDSPTGKFIMDNYNYEINIAGEHNIINATCGVLIGKLFGGSASDIQKGLYEFEQVKLRQNFERVNKKTLIVDCYNASLDSDLAAFKVLKSADGNRKVAILGSIGELGEHLGEILNKVGEGVYENEIDLLITVDENSSYINEGAKNAGMPTDKMLHYETKEEFFKEINSILLPEDTVLIKASRKYKFEEIYSFLKDQ